MSRTRRFDWLFRPQLADEDLPLSAEARFAEALAELPAVERSALALSEIGGLDTDEIAERLGTDPAVVRRLLFRARTTVRSSLAAQGRRGLAVLVPLQNLFQLGWPAPAVRAAGIVAAAVVAPTVLTGGAAADPPRAVRPSAEPALVRQAARADHPVAVAPAARDAEAATAATPAPVGRAAAPSRHRPVRPGNGRRDRRPSAPVPARPEQPLRRERAHHHPVPTVASRRPARARVAVPRPTLPSLPAAPPVELPAPVPGPPALPVPPLPPVPPVVPPPPPLP